MAASGYRDAGADGCGGAAQSGPSPPSGEAAPSSAGARAWSVNSPINIRLSIPLGFDRFYLTIVGGRERRGRDRQRRERRKHPLWTATNLLFLAAVGTMTGLAFSRSCS
jgi:hypothetical protein